MKHLVTLVRCSSRLLSESKADCLAELYGFPGLIFEVFKTRAVSSLTVF